MAQRATCWSITINNPTEEDFDAVANRQGVVWFKQFEGQIEKGENGTPHIQGMLRTASTKFSAVKKLFPRAHIEIAKSPTALQKYVTKEETRVGELPTAKCASVGTLNKYIFEYIKPRPPTVEDYISLIIRDAKRCGEDHPGIALLDALTRVIMADGYYGVEYIAANPSVRTTWKKFWKNILEREYINASPIQVQDEGETLPPPAPAQGEEDGSTNGDMLHEGDV